MEAVMKGANVVYMAYQKTDGNHYGGYFQASKAAETIYTGIAYSNITLNKNDFSKRVADADLLTSKEQIILLKGMAISKSEYEKYFIPTDVRIKRVFTEGSQLYLEGMIKGFDSTTFRIVRFDSDTFTLLAEDTRKTVNFIVSFR